MTGKYAWLVEKFILPEGQRYLFCRGNEMP